MSHQEPTVFIVDDDEALCDSLCEFLTSEGLSVKCFHSAEAFLSSYDPCQPGCLVLDVRMRGMSGLDLQAALVRQGIQLPVIVVTGHGDIPMAVRATRAGAVEFLEKPVAEDVLLRHVRAALEQDRQARAQSDRLRCVTENFARLTPRERQVMRLIAAGLANKQIAARLGITEKTVEVHRRQVFSKMRVQGAVELASLIAQAKLPLE